VYRPFNEKIFYKDSPLHVYRQTEGIFGKQSQLVKPRTNHEPFIQFRSSPWFKNPKPWFIWIQLFT